MLPYKQPTVSIVMPVYDRWTLAAEAVNSVRLQTFADWELILVDDGSEETGGSNAIVATDPRIRLERIPHTGNVAKVRNRGLEVSVGKWVAFIDSDDLWAPTKLEEQLKALADSSAKWSFTRMEILESGRRRLGPETPRPPVDADDLVRGIIDSRWAVPVVSLIADREALLRLGGFDESAALLLREDLDLSLRLAARLPAVPVPAALVTIRDHESRSTRSAHDPFLLSANVQRAVLRREHDSGVRKAARRVMGRHLISSARLDMTAGRRADALSKLREAIWPGILSPRWWAILLWALLARAR
jgi:glycosyltransferase involved in cell wall biosynthesis